MFRLSPIYVYQLCLTLCVCMCAGNINGQICTDCFYVRFVGLPSTKLHNLLLDHHNMKLTWYIDWPKKEVLFNVDDAFTDDTDWFSLGFSKRGQIEGSDICFFVKSIYDESYNEAIVSLLKLCLQCHLFSLYVPFYLFLFLFCLCLSLLLSNLGYVHWNR